MNHEEFEALGTEEQAKYFFTCPLEEKGELLPYSHDPEVLAHNLSPEEIYLMVQHLDRDDKAEIVRYAAPEQLLFITDLQCWNRDRLNPQHFTGWIETLLTEEEQFLKWAQAIDVETMISGLKTIIRVVKREWEYAIDELLGDEPYFTLDDYYYIAVDEERMQVVRRMVELIYENHRGRYVALLESVMNEIDDGVEEEAYQMRLRRLADRGFPEPEIAGQIFRAMSKEEFDLFPEKKYEEAKREAPVFDEAARDGTVKSSVIPNYPQIWSQDRLLFDEVLLLFKDEDVLVKERLGEELVWLSNKVIAAGGIDFASEKSIRDGVERARRIVNIGLQALSGNDPVRAKEILSSRWMENIFRYGMGEILKVRDHAAALLKEYWQGRNVDFTLFLDTPYDHVMRGILEAVPRCSGGESPEEVYPLRDFKDQRDLSETLERVKEIFALTGLLARVDPAWEKKRAQALVEKEREITLFMLLGNAFVNFVLRKKESIKLHSKDLLPFLKVAFQIEGGKHLLSAGLRTEFLEKWRDEEHGAALERGLSVLFSRLEEEFVQVEDGKELDPKFISVFYFAD